MDSRPALPLEPRFDEHPYGAEHGRAVPSLGDTPVGHMSPITALCFLLAAASFFASLPRPAGARAHPAWAAAWTAAGLLLAASGVLLLAYLFGSPLLYGSSFIPPAATTSFAFASLAAAMLALAPRTRRESGEGPEVSGVPTRLALVFLLLSIGIVTVGWLYFRHPPCTRTGTPAGCGAPLRRVPPPAPGRRGGCAR